MTARIIPFIPAPHGEPSQLLRAMRERCGLNLSEFARLLGPRIDRPDLTAGALRAWENGTVRPSQVILDAAAALNDCNVPVQRPATTGAVRHEDVASLADLQEALHRIERAYGNAPATSLLPAASRHLGQIALLRTIISVPGARRELDACEAEAATLMGQLVWDASQRRDHTTARAYFDHAIATARQVGDPIAAGRALLRKSFIALYGERDPTNGLVLAQQAAQATIGVSHALTSLGLLHAAEAHAMLGNGHDCDVTLAAADSHLGRSNHNDTAAYLIAEREFDRLAGSCYLSLGRYHDARSILTAIADRPHHRPKSRAIVLGNLALTHLRQREIDAAAGVLHQAIDITAQTRGAGGLNLIFRVGRELAPWRQDPIVQHVHDRLHDLMTTS